MRSTGSYVRRYGEVVGAALLAALQREAGYSSAASRHPARAAEFRAESERWGRAAEQLKSVVSRLEAEARAVLAEAGREEPERPPAWEDDIPAVAGD